MTAVVKVIRQSTAKKEEEKRVGQTKWGTSESTAATNSAGFKRQKQVIVVFKEP